MSERLASKGVDYAAQAEIARLKEQLDEAKAELIRGADCIDSLRLSLDEAVKGLEQIGYEGADPMSARETLDRIKQMGGDE